MKLSEQVLLTAVESVNSLINFLKRVEQLDEFNKEMLINDVFLPLMQNSEFESIFSNSLLRQLFWLPLHFHKISDEGKIFFHQAFMPFVEEIIRNDYSEQLLYKFESALLFQAGSIGRFELETYLAEILVYYTCLDILEFIEYTKIIPVEILSKVLEKLYTATDFQDFVTQLSANVYQLPELINSLDEERAGRLLDYFEFEPTFELILLENFDSATSIADYFHLTSIRVLPVAFALLAPIFKHRIFYPNDFSTICKVLPEHYKSKLYEQYKEYLQNWARNHDELRALLSVLTINDFKTHLNNHALTVAHYFNTAERYEKLLRVLPEDKRSVLASHLVSSIAEVIQTKTHLQKMMKLLSVENCRDLCEVIGSVEITWMLQWFDKGRLTCRMLAPEKAQILFEYLQPLFTSSLRALQTFPEFLHDQSIEHIRLYAMKIRVHLSSCMYSFEDYMRLLTSRHLDGDQRKVLNESLGDSVYHLIRTQEDFGRALIQVPLELRQEMMMLRAATISIQALSELLSGSTSQWYRMTHRDRSKEGVFADIARVAGMYYLMKESQVKELLLTLYTTANHARGLGKNPQSARVIKNYLASEAGECLRALIIPMVPDMARQLRPAIASISP